VTIKTSGNQDRRWTNRFASARNLKKEKKRRKKCVTYLSPWNVRDAWHPPRAIRKTGNLSHFQIPDSYSDWIPALRMWSRNHFPSIRVLSCSAKEEPRIHLISLRHFIKVCKLSKLFVSVDFALNVYLYNNHACV
jgi:hypothetical protein